MKVALIAIPLLGACSFQPMSDPTPLQPLPTTGKSSLVTDIDDRTTLERQTDFIANVRKQYVGPVPMNDSEIIQTGQMWCDARSSGLTMGDAMDFVEAIATTDQERRFTQTIIANAILDLCR